MIYTHDSQNKKTLTLSYVDKFGVHKKITGLFVRYENQRVRVWPEKVTIPDCSGLSQEDAIILLRSMGIKVGFVFGYNSVTEEGDVVSNTFNGEILNIGSVVVLNVSLGPAPPDLDIFQMTTDAVVAMPEDPENNNVLDIYQMTTDVVIPLPESPENNNVLDIFQLTTDVVVPMPESPENNNVLDIFQLTTDVVVVVEVV